MLWLAAAALTACGGGGMSNMSPNTSMPTSSMPTQSCSNCGTALVSLTDAPGDFISYIVNVVSLQLTRADGTVVQTVPVTTQVDFAQLVNLSEIVSADQIPSGQYVSASMTLDYSNATIVVDNGSGGVTIAAGNIINGATSMPLAAPNPTQVTLTLMLDANNYLVISPGVIANLALDFNLAASNTIAPSDTDPTTVTVNPVLTGSLAPDVSKQIRVRGPFVSADAAMSDFIINVRPFYNLSGANGQLTVATTSTTTYAINGTSYTGAAGLAELAMSPVGTMIMAYGTWDTTTQSFTAASVLAGSSVPGGKLDTLSGLVTSRSGNTFTVADDLLLRPQFVLAFARQAMVSVGAATTVMELGQSGSFSIADISVGQHIQVFGSYSASTAPSTSPPTLDATAGSVQLIPTSVSGSVTMSAVNTVTLNLQSIDGLAASNFNFAGTGMTPAQDATASAYTVAVPPSLTVGAVGADSPAQFTGFVAPFGSAPPDFNAITLVSFANTEAQLQVTWLSGDAMPFTTLSDTELKISQTALQASNLDVIGVGFERIDPSTLASGLQLVPDPAATRQYFAISHLKSWTQQSYSSFSDLVAALSTDLIGSTEVLQVNARGPYSASTGVLSADVIEVLLND